MLLALLGIYTALVLWVSRRLPRPWLFSTILVALGAGVSGLIAGWNEPVFLDDSRWFDRSPARDLLLFLALLGGMVARSLTEAIEQRRAAIEAARSAGKGSRRPRLRLDPWEFSYPLFVSVVVFAGVRAAAGGAPLTVATMLLSFQNGFFWQTILRRQSQSI